MTYAARHPKFARRLRVERLKMRSALTEALERSVPDRLPSALPAEDLSLILIALVNGLAIQELTDPGSVPDDLLGKATARLLERDA